MKFKDILPYLFVLVVIIIVFFGVMYLNKVSGFNMWLGLDTAYCDNLCELGRMG